MYWLFSMNGTKHSYIPFRISNTCTSWNSHQYHLCKFLCVRNYLCPYSRDRPPSVDETGDYIAWSQHQTSGTIHQATYCTLFDIRRAYDPPDIEFTKPVTPAQPQPVSIGPASLLGSWFTFNQTLSGDQVDTLRKLCLKDHMVYHLKCDKSGRPW